MADGEFVEENDGRAHSYELIHAEAVKQAVTNLRL